MDINPDYVCPICLEIAREAVESSCCTKLFCHACSLSISSKFEECPCCRSKDVHFKQSKFTRKIISQIKLPCPHCSLSVQNGQLNAHFQKCPKIQIQCSICKNPYSQAEIVKHTASEHESEARSQILRILLEGGKGSKKQGAEKSKSKISGLQQRAFDFYGPLKNRNGIEANIGTVQKYYCGGLLLGKCQCCDGHCGPTNGQNCDACMELDVMRLGLEKGYFVNQHGYVCQVNPNPLVKTVACFRNYFSHGIVSNRQCVWTNPCEACASVSNSLVLGRYQSLY